MSIKAGPAAEARLRALQGATQTYAQLWQAPLLPVALGAGQLLAGLGLYLLDAARVGQLLVWYSPLTWAIANRIARARWTPPLGEVSLHWTQGGSLPRAARVLASLGLVFLAVAAFGFHEPHLAVVSLGTLTLLWTAPARPGSGLPFVGAAFFFVKTSARRASFLLGLAATLLVGALFVAYQRRAAARTLTTAGAP